MNIGEDKKKHLLEQQNEHITRAMKERDLYKDAVKCCKETLQNTESRSLEKTACMLIDSNGSLLLQSCSAGTLSLKSTTTRTRIF